MFSVQNYNNVTPQVCAALRKMSSVLRLGVYRERIEKYGRPPSRASQVVANPNPGPNEVKYFYYPPNIFIFKTFLPQDMLSVTLERQTGKHLGIRISGSCPEPGIFIVEILDDSITALDGEFNIDDLKIIYCLYPENILCEEKYFTRCNDCVI